MKKTFQSSTIFLLIVIILGIGIGMIAGYINKLAQQEGFSPMFKQIYNPIVRKVRNYTNNKIEHFSNTTSIFLKRFRFY